MGNVFCHPRAECPVNAGELVIQNVNSMHHRRLQRWKVKTFFPQFDFTVSHFQASKPNPTFLTQWPAKRRRIPIQPDILPELPKLHDFTGETSKQLRAKFFEDPDFPATNASIGGVTGDHANPNVAKYLEEMMKLIVPGWVRPVEMIGKEAGIYQLFATEGEPCLFKRVSPRDIEQGYLGNCWLVAAMSTLAEYPDRVRSLFKQKTLSEDGRYDVRLYDPRSEEWKLVTIDDRLPYWQRPGKHGNICFTKQTKENEFWPCLLEKAVAKFVMAYYRLDGGFSSVGMEMFTGKPSVCMHLNSTPENPEGPHVPFSLVTGETWETSKHATVLLRKDTFDLDWGYWGQDASSLVGGKTEFSDDDLWKQLKEWDDSGYSQSGGSRTDYKGILASSLDQRVSNDVQFFKYLKASIQEESDEIFERNQMETVNSFSDSPDSPCIRYMQSCHLSLWGHAYTLLRLVDVPITRKDNNGKEALMQTVLRTKLTLKKKKMNFWVIQHHFLNQTADIWIEFNMIFDKNSSFQIRNGEIWAGEVCFEVAPCAQSACDQRVVRPLQRRRLGNVACLSRSFGGHGPQSWLQGPTGMTERKKTRNFLYSFFFVLVAPLSGNRSQGLDTSGKLKTWIFQDQLLTNP